MNYVDEIKRLMGDFNLISFDVFDTLLQWPSKDPSDVIRDFGRRMGLENFEQKRRTAILRAYDMARSTGREEITLDEIYSLLPYARGTAEAELEYVRGMLTVNPKAAELWNFARASGKRCVIASDMYYPAAFVRNALNAHGIEGWTGFYISSEKGVRKSSGKMFQLILDDLCTKPKCWLHIGDNLISDVKVVSSLGGVGIPWPQPCEMFKECYPFARDFLLSHLGGAQEKRKLLAAVSRTWDDSRWNCQGAWFHIGVLACGVLAYAYARWLLREIDRGRYSDVLLVARDGYLIGQLLERMGCRRRLHYVYAPRGVRACLVPAEEDVGLDRRTVALRRQLRLSMLEKVLGVSVAGKSATQYLECGKLDGTFVTSIEHLCSVVKSEYASYVSSLGVDWAHACLVDGFSKSGSAQSLLSEFSSTKIPAFYFAALSPEVVGNALYRVYKRAPAFWGLAEFSLSAPTPSVMCILHGNPVYATPENFHQQRRKEVFANIERGALALADNLLSADVDVTRDTLTAWMNAFAFGMNATDRMILEEVKNQNGNECWSIIPEQKEKTTVKSFLGCTLLKSVRSREGADDVRRKWLFGILPLPTKTYSEWE